MLSGEQVTLPLSTSVALVPGRNLAVRYAQTRQQYPYLPDMALLSAEMNELTRTGGVPVSVDDGKPWIRFYARRCCVGVRATSRGDAFSIEFIEPLNLRNHERLAGSRLRVAPRSWIYSALLNAIPPGCQAPDQQIRSAWQHSRRQSDHSADQGRPTRHDVFCAALDLVVEGARQIEAAKDRVRPALPYYEVRSAAETRHSAAGIYDFLLSRPGRIEPGAMVELRHAPDLRGKVSTVDGERLAVHFDTAVDRRRIPAQGELIISGGDLIQRIQRDAIARLRGGTTLNPNLLSLLADATFAAYHGPPPDVATLQPAEPLDDDQQDAYRRALSVPDLLCVLGPPGTGKTRTIVEIARSAAARGERVLIASQTNTAVDNCMERLPAALTAIRVGNEDRITGAARNKTLAATAAELQQRILSRSEVTALRLAPWLAEPRPAQGWLRRLDAGLADVNEARNANNTALTAWATAVAAIESRLGEPVQQSHLAWQTAQREAATGLENVQQLTAHQQRAESKANGPLGFWYRWSANRYRGRLAQATHYTAQAQARSAQAERDHASRTEELRRTVGRDTAVLRAGAQATAAQAAIGVALDRAQQAAQQFARLLAGIVGVPTVPDDDGLIHFAEWCRGIDAMLQVRARLLRDWREQLTQPAEQLHAELIRDADVIGATCIGVGVQKNKLSDLEFDLAIIDEAGQIPLTSTLVPLIRARRAVLVGDHHQLPPFVDDEVRQWLQRHPLTDTRIEAAQLTELLTHSAFERLIRAAPPANQVLLSQQRRMPAVLSDFISTRFYQGRLGTATEPRPRSAIFRSPLVLVDTADLPARDRAERRRDKTETWQTAGCDNLAEARLVLDLVQWYARYGRQWAVIAPYRAQVQLLTQRLRELLDDDAVRDRVGTVDTFQGREYDIVVYSFTRSNPAARVGFLAELRRLNVAITRAREQLILIGDYSTLVRAQDPGFRHLAGELFSYAQQHGDIVASRRLRDRLR